LIEGRERILDDALGGLLGWERDGGAGKRRALSGGAGWSEGGSGGARGGRDVADVGEGAGGEGGEEDGSSRGSRQGGGSEAGERHGGEASLSGVWRLVMLFSWCFGRFDGVVEVRTNDDAWCS